MNMEKIFVRLNDRLSLTFESTKLLETITSAAFYKINIKRHVDYQADKTVVLCDNLSYLVVSRIIDVFKWNESKRGYSLEVENTVTAYIASREMYLEARSRLGIELKQHDPKLSKQFDEFASIVCQELTRTLRPRQLWDAFFMTTMKKSSNFSVPGSGKTSSVYGMYAFLHRNGHAKRIVVICPKNAYGPWIDEFRACFGNKQALNLFCIHADQYHSASQRKSALKYESGAANLLLFNYECTKSYEYEIKDLLDDQTILVFDEVHKVKRIDGEYAKAAISIAKDANYTVAMTGTPIPNSYQDIYNLLHILYHEEYEDFFGFPIASLREPSGITIDKVNRKLQPFFCRTTKDQLNVPRPNSDSIIPVPANDTESRLFNLLVMKYKKSKLLLMLRVLQLESNPQALLSSINLSDFQYLLEDDLPADEIDYADYSSEIVSLIQTCGITTKMHQLINLIRGLVLQGKPVVVWCIFVKTIQTVVTLLKSEGIKVRCVYGEIPLDERESILQDFKDSYFNVLVTNPNTLAESISLHTICHDAVYFEYSFNLVHLLQSKDRIHRLGLEADQYTQFYFLETMYPTQNGYYSMGGQIYERLAEKEKRMLTAIDADLLETMPTTDEDLDLIFAQVL